MKATSIILLLALGGFLAAPCAFADNVDFPQVGKSYNIELVPTGDGHRVEFPDSEHRSSVKIVARASNGWCLVEYRVGYLGKYGAEAKTAWINFNQVVIAEEQPNQALLPTPTAVTHPAAQAARQP
jgi:hypothetical protein